MGLFSKKSEEQKKKAETKIEELCGGVLGNKNFQNKLIENNLNETTANGNYKRVLKYEIKNGSLNYDDIESRLDELMKLDVTTLDLKIRMRHEQDTALFKTQEDINDFMGEEYSEKYNKYLKNSKAKNLEKEKEKARKEEEKRIKNLEKRKEKARNLKEKFNIDLTGKNGLNVLLRKLNIVLFLINLVEMLILHML